MSKSKIDSTTFDIRQLLHSSLQPWNDDEIHFRCQRAQLKVLQPVEISPSWIHWHFHLKLLRMCSLHSIKRWSDADFTRIRLECVYGCNGKWRSQLVIAFNAFVSHKLDERESNWIKSFLNRLTNFTLHVQTFVITFRTSSTSIDLWTRNIQSLQFEWETICHSLYNFSFHFLWVFLSIF